MIFVIKHIDVEGPGTLGEFLKGIGFRLEVIELQNGDQLPADLSCMEAVVVLGGPMNVYEENKYSFLKEEDIFLKEVFKRDIPLLGICLGSQLMAKASGAAVKKLRSKK